MKKILGVFAIILLASISAQAQSISKNALGLRLGDNDGFGGEISYQRYLKENNRLEFDLGWRDSNNVDAFKLVGLYQWVMPIEGNFNWFVGAGAGIGSFDAGENDGTFALIAGDIGIEYNFDFPLILSLDMRPELGFNDNYSDDLDLDIALGIRYQF
ncbi:MULTISPECIES: hypothetical protein [Cellulophaga]|jgi:hypothetical protein|uniref:Uncharacterized protein n=2 Tax=Cellulophaga baltica TaxID=76594 RepID=A0A1G7DDN8_9FLAO|nr:MULTISPECIES: hypothetical protein [Cellulophaga]WFO14785.1 hypothetical protein M601_012635 [Cellulophaga baltica 4]AIY12872.1 hypothetical protein M667_06425 [Cellulophaga baltica NN016038]AIZ41240.1 hypothetical protein M666_06440 [Cellulophaga baltica 18]KGK32130.1 hypothetical protein EL45_02300 [Cellulophaga sp. E6(2014)]MBA6313597.1 hypothetical protein [Cellulophaga baltica]